MQRVMQEQRDMCDLLIEVHPVLCPEIMLAEQEAMIGGDHQRGVAPEIVPVEIVEQLAQQEVAQRHDGVVVGPQLLALFRQLVDAAVARPVADRAVPAGPERLPESRRGMEGLVRIEGLHLQHPVIRSPVAVEELETAGEALDGRKILLLADELAVDDVVAHVAARAWC